MMLKKGKTIIDEIKKLFLKDEHNEVITRYEEYEKSKIMDLEILVQFTSFYAHSLRFKNRASEAFDKLKQFEEQLEDLKPEYLKLIVITTKCYLLELENDHQQAINIYLKWKNHFDTFKFEKDLEKSYHALYFHMSAFIYSNEGKAKQSFDLCEKSIKIREELINKGYDVTWQTRQRAVTLNNVSLYLASLGENQKALQVAKEAYDIHKELNSLSALGFAAANYGRNLQILGRLNESIDKFKESLLCFEKINIINIAEVAHQSLIATYLTIGDYNRALFYIKQMEEVLQKSSESNQFPTFLWRARYFRKSGELHKAITYFLKLKELIKKYLSSNESFKIYIDIELSDVYLEIGDLTHAKEFLILIFDYLETVNLPKFREFLINFDLINVLVKISDIKTAKRLFDKSSELVKSFEAKGNTFFLIQHKFSKAIILKHSSRLKERLSAIDDFKDLIQLDILYYDIINQSIINILDLLLLEYQLEENPEIFLEIKENLEKLTNISQKQQNQSFSVESLILKSKVSIIEGDTEKAFQYLQKALSKSEEHELTFYMKKVNEEIDRLKDEIENLSLNSLELKERIDLSQMKDYFKDLQRTMKINILDR